MPSSAYAIAAAILAVVGFLIWFGRGQKKAGTAEARADASEAGIKVIGQINEESKKRDEETNAKLEKINSPGNDPADFWVRNDPQKRRVSDLPDTGQTGARDAKVDG